MSDPQASSNDPAELRGPGDPDTVETPHPQGGTPQAGNIREEQLTHAAGTVPAAYVGSGDPEAKDKPEEAAGAGMWDEDA
jgi:hypothetical protein